MIYSDGSTASAMYSSFSVGEEHSTQYTLRVSGYSGTPNKDALDADVGSPSWASNGMMFSTYDRDNDNFGGGRCAGTEGGFGWWFNHCSSSDLNRDGYTHWVTLGTVSSSTMKTISG